MHVIMSSSESGLEESDVELKKAGILADAILTCTAQMKDGKYEDVYITGEGMITEKRGLKAVVRIGAKEEKEAEKKEGPEEDKKTGTYDLLFCDDSDDGKNEIYSKVTLSPFHIAFLDAAPGSQNDRQDAKTEGNTDVV